MYLPEVPSTCTNIRFSVMAQTGNRPPPESRDWGRTWTAGREPERGAEDRDSSRWANRSARWVKDDDSCQKKTKRMQQQQSRRDGLLYEFQGGIRSMLMLCWLYINLMETLTLWELQLAFRDSRGNSARCRFAEQTRQTGLITTIMTEEGKQANFLESHIPKCHVWLTEGSLLMGHPSTGIPEYSIHLRSNFE